MRLYEQPCAAVQVGRKRYPLRLTYDRVLFVLDALNDPLLTDQDRLRLALGLLMRGRVPRSLHLQEQLLNAIMAAIDQQNKKHDGPPSRSGTRPTSDSDCSQSRSEAQHGACRRDGPPVMSLIQDAPLIHAAFRQAYGIDLHKVDLPWETFCLLLSGLPENTRFCEVVAIRARPIPQPDKHNGKYIEELLKAKASVALELSPEQQESSFQTGLNSLAKSLMAWAMHYADTEPDAKPRHQSQKVVKPHE